MLQSLKWAQLIAFFFKFSFQSFTLYGKFPLRRYSANLYWFWNYFRNLVFSLLLSLDWFHCCSVKLQAAVGKSFWNISEGIHLSYCCMLATLPNSNRMYFLTFWQVIHRWYHVSYSLLRNLTTNSSSLR